MRVMRTMWTTFMRSREASVELRRDRIVGKLGSDLRVPVTGERTGPPCQKNRASFLVPVFGAPTAKRGFTLFELVIVLSVIVILATMGLVGYQASVPPGAVNAARNELHGLLRFAREQAIVRGSNSMLIIIYDNTDRAKF